jgi:hypothetical protein
MMKVISAIAVASAFMFLLPAAPAQAQATRTWVSGVGDDANPCSRTAPCKTFAGAISKTAVKGEISVLDPGGFGAVTITKSISIIAEGSEGSILAALTNGIIINITNPADDGVVNLHGLFIEGAGTGLNGIRVLSAKSVNIQRCLIRGFKSGATGAAIDINPVSVGTEVAISNSSLNSNIRGVRALGSGAGTALVSLDHVNINGVARGIDAGANATVRLSNSAITGANSAITHSGSGQVISFGNNAISGNVISANDDPTSTIALK